MKENSEKQKDNSSEKHISMQEASKLCLYSQEYLSLLARRGKLASKKIGRNWFTTREALDEYLSKQSIVVSIPKNILQANASSYLKSESGKPILVTSETEPKPIRAIESAPVFSPAQLLTEPSPEQFYSKPEFPKQIVEEKITQVMTELERSASERRESENYILQHLNYLSSQAQYKDIPQYPAPEPEKPAKRMVIIAIAAVVLLFLIVGGFSFGNSDFVAEKIRNLFQNAQTLQGHQPGTHANEVLVLDKAGNINIFGHIETEGQLRSRAPEGVAPIVVDSVTKVENLNADYLDDLDSKDFTLAFVTKNGNLTYEDVKLEGNVEVGKNLTIKGAFNLLDALNVYGKLGVFGEAVFGKGLSVTGGNVKIENGNLQLGNGTIEIANRTMIPNLNAELWQGRTRADFNLDYVVSNGNSTNKLAFFNGGLFGGNGSFTSLGVAKDASFGSTADSSNIGFSVFSKEFTLDASGNMTIGGNLSLTGSVISSFEIQGVASISSLTGTAFGDDCSDETQTLNWSSSTGKFSCLADAGAGGGAVTSNSIDFDEIVDAMTLDANTTIASNGFSFSIMGNVGIGTTAPLSTLDVRIRNHAVIFNPTIASLSLGPTPLEGAEIGIIRSRSSFPCCDIHVGRIVFAGSIDNYGLNRPAAAVEAITDAVWSGDTSPTAIRFLTTSAFGEFPGERMRISSKGLVGIGSSSPGSLLDIKGSASFNPITIASSSGDPVFRINKSGFVGIGSSSPSSLLTIQGGNITHVAATDPVQVGSLALAANSATINANVDVSGNVAYAVDGDDLNIIDISNPASPSLMNTFVTAGSASWVQIVGTRAYIADGNSVLIADVRNALSPSIVGSISLGVLPTATSPVTLQVVGKYIYAADRGNSRVAIIDASNPTRPIIASTIALSATEPSNLSVSGNYLFVSRNNNGFRIYDVSNPRVPVIVSSVTGFNSRAGIQAIGRYLYIAGTSGFKIYDIKNPASPILLSTDTSISGFGLIAAG
ncbi:MAG: hypothetical protein Q8P35_00505, partial [Candidatus Yanofskybacteria bacterium]|nr:hypothetical protein [Candidatus Yanofskybacteria bacterium]